MAEYINTNVQSLVAQRNLASSQKNLTGVLERLSTGLRINSAKDDAAGLAISERMTAQINGLDMAVRNANDGISFAQTAESALSTIGTNLQRIRELAVQSTNASNSAGDRISLNNEVQALISEIGRVSVNTEFNGRSILDGSANNLFFQIGANQGQMISVSGVDSRTTKLGTFESVASGAEVSVNTLNNASTVVVSAIRFTVAGVAITAQGVGDYEDVTGNVTNASGGGGGLGGTAAMEQAVSNINKAITEAINGTGITASGTTITQNAVTYTSGEQQKIAEAGARAQLRIDSEGNYNIVLTSTYASTTALETPGLDPVTGEVYANDRNTSCGATATASIKQMAIATFDRLDASANTLVAVGFRGGLNSDIGDGDVSGVNLTAAVAALPDDSSATGIAANDIDTGESSFLSASGYQGVRADGTKVEDNVFEALGMNFEAAFAAFGDVSGNGSLTTDGAGTAPTAWSDLTIAKSSDSSGTVNINGAGDSSGGVAVNTVTLNDLNVLNRENATQAIGIIDGALDRVNALRAELGATQVRFETAIENLTVTSDNLSAARMRIQDADFAAETAALTKGQILQQAGISVLAQANAGPQNALALLQ